MVYNTQTIMEWKQMGFRNSTKKKAKESQSKHKKKEGKQFCTKVSQRKTEKKRPMQDMSVPHFPISQRHGCKEV